MGILAAIPILDKLIDRVLPDPEAKMELKLELAKLADAEAAREHSERLAQTEVNKAEAGHRSIFVAGWRPAIGWGCGAALIYNTLLAPAFNLGVADLGFLQTVLLGMLGISASRTVEKIKGVTNDVLPLRKTELQPTPIALPAPTPKKKKGPDLWPF
jgi:hypothetical protein